MRSNSGAKRQFDWILDTLASRLGIIAVVGVLVSVGLGVGTYVQAVVTQLEENHTVFHDRQTRNGYVAMSDIQRLILVTQRALEAGEMTPELENDYRDAADIMYVRTDNFERIMKREQTKLDSGAKAIAALHDVVEIADQGLAQGFPDIKALQKSLLKANIAAREQLVLFLDDMRRQGETVLDAQSRAVRQQRTVVLGNLVGLTIIGAAALFLLRREVLARRARELAEERVEFLAYFDPLTKLPNRAQFQDHLQELLKRNDPVALFYIDLDDFKLINDTHGHAAGDAVLCHVGRILLAVAQANNGFAARLAGDEFALLIPSDNIDRLISICDGIIAAAAETYWFEGEAFVVGVSLGLATTTQLGSSESKTVDMLSRVTDFALYTSKATGRKTYTVYDHIIEQRFWERRALLEELPRAIEQGDLDVYLQPKVTFPGEDVYGFEALVRWRQAGRIVPPDEFITIAEEAGFVVDIDRFVLRRAAEIISRWNFTHGTDFSVSVNLSALNFNSRRISHYVEQALSDAELPPRLLTLEVTETSQMRDWKKASEVIDDLKAIGCKIAIDDFGTGFSSLAYLRVMKAHELKVDRSLVTELADSKKARLLLSSVLEIALNFELSVTIEGVETEAQAEIAKRMGIGSAQGYLYGRPRPPEEALPAAMGSDWSELLIRAS